MYELKLEKNKFYRVKRGQTAGNVEKTLGIPVAEAFEGMIIVVPDGDFFVYKADVGDNYHTLAEKFGVSEEDLKKLNGNKSVYPTSRLIVPRK